MIQRISDEAIEFCLKHERNYSYTMVDMARDLKDARTRIAELERLSASQSEAMDMMDRGAL